MVAEPHADPKEIAARLSRWRRTGDLGALWPDVPYAARQKAMARIGAIVRAMLVQSAGAPTTPSTPRPAASPTPTTRPPALDARDAHEARALGVAAFITGTGPLLGWWTHHGQLDATPPVSEVLAQHLDHGRRRSALLRSQLARIVAAMDTAGARPVLLKGLHTGAEFFPHPSTRPAADIDLLVHPSESGRAADALSDLGFVETRRTTFSARSEWTLAGAPERIRSLDVDHAENPWGVDLHRALERWYFRGTRRDLGDEPFETTRWITVEGTRIRVLDQPYLTTFLALHACYDLGHMQLVRLVDVVLATRADARSGRLQWRDVGSRLERTDTTRFAYPALALAEELAPGTVDADVLALAAGRTTPRMRRVLEQVRRAEYGPLRARSLDLKLAWAAGPLETLMNLTEVALPSDDGMGGWRIILARRLAAVRGFGSGASRGPDVPVHASTPSGDRPGEGTVTSQGPPSDPAALPPAVRAFDVTAPRFDERFGAWRSVAAQRAAVRSYLTRIFPVGSRLLELGAGTGEDAIYLLERGYRITLTDGSPRMVQLATAKLRGAGFDAAVAPVEQLVIEDMEPYAGSDEVAAGTFDGVYSNFAALNCVRDLGSLAAPLARLVRPGGSVALVVFGPCSIGEVVVELLRRRPLAAFRRFRSGGAPAKLGGEHFEVWYPSPREVARALAPYFRLRAVRGIGILVPPSAAEPWISNFPGLVSALERADRILTAPLALLGDHVLVHLERTERSAPSLVNGV